MTGTVILVGYSVFKGIAASLGAQSIDRERLKARDAKIEKFRRGHEDALAEIRTLAVLMGEKMSWKDGEAGFAIVDEADADRLLKAAANSDFVYLLARNEELIKVRPARPVPPGVLRRPDRAVRRAVVGGRQPVRGETVRRNQR